MLPPRGPREPTVPPSSSTTRATATGAAPSTPKEGQWEAAPTNPWLDFTAAEPQAQAHGWQAYGADQGWQRHSQNWRQPNTQQNTQQWAEGGPFLPTRTATGGWHDDQGWLIKGDRQGKGVDNNRGWQEDQGWQDNSKGDGGKKGGGRTYAQAQAQGKTQAQGKRGGDGKGGKDGKVIKYGEKKGDKGIWC